MPPWHPNCQFVMIKAVRPPTIGELEKWTTPRTVKSLVGNAKSRLMVVPSPSRPPSTSVRTAGSHSFDGFSENLLTAMRPVNQRRFKGKTSTTR